ncbi:MAG: BamA/TamA family outer membrane protein [Saprospiraceae bacterium]|nr:BamA/TamA family outer membrane protein [Saprospiraceae bacterium]
MQKVILHLILSILFFLLCAPAFGFSANDGDTTQIKNQILAYPIIYYLPETRWGFGGAGFYTFRFSDEPLNSNPSQIQFTFSITQKKQYIFTIPFEIYRNKNLWKFKGEVSYYRYLYNFYGIGQDSKFAEKETFNANYPRIRIDILRRFKSVYAGIRIRYDNMVINGLKNNGLIESTNLTGKDGGTSSGIGLVAQLDTRNYIYNPSSGIYSEAEIFTNDKFFHSDFSYKRYSLDLVKYTSLAENHTLALQIYTASIAGNPFFYDMLYFGSPRIMRGFQDRRFKDRNILVLQSEYRFPIYKRLQGVGFLSTGSVSNKYMDLFSNEYKLSYGSGLRFILNEKDRIRLRVDYGLTLHEGGSFYITINEAF